LARKNSNGSSLRKCSFKLIKIMALGIEFSKESKVGNANMYGEDPLKNLLARKAQIFIIRLFFLA
jgi:hypothetical protein